jgi:hypothetical protein
MTHIFSKSAFYSFGDIPLAAPLPLMFSHLLRDYQKSVGGGTLFTRLTNKWQDKEPG